MRRQRVTAVPSISSIDWLRRSRVSARLIGSLIVGSEPAASVTVQGSSNAKVIAARAAINGRVGSDETLRALADGHTVPGRPHAALTLAVGW